MTARAPGPRARVAALARGVQARGHLLGWRLVRRLPDRIAYPLFDCFADLTWCRRGTGVRQLEHNLARVRPGVGAGELRALSRAGMRSYLRYWCDTFRLPSWSPQRLLAGCRVLGDGPARAVLAQGRGVVLALAHQGNWDHAGAWSTSQLARVTTVAERLEPPEVFERFLAFRQALGMEILPLTDGGTVLRTLTRRLRQGALVPLLADRDLTSGGVEVTFFGEPARMAVGPAALADVTGAALYPVSIWYERTAATGSGWGIVARFHPEVRAPASTDRRERLSAMTQACADALAEGIAAHPQDWHMLQPVFVADLDRRPAPTRAGGPG